MNRLIRFWEYLQHGYGVITDEKASYNGAGLNNNRHHRTYCSELLFT